MTRRHLALLATAWTVFAVYGSLVPLEYRPTDLAAAIQRFRNLPPLGAGMGTRADWVANILLFVPLTFLWMGALTCGGARGARLTAAAVLPPLASLSAIALEFTQIWFAGRTVSVNDIVAETIGGTAGVALWLGLGERTVAWIRGFLVETRARSQLEWWLQAYVIGLVIYSVIPLDLTISFTELLHKYERGLIQLVPFSYPYESVSTAIYQYFADIVEFVPVGAWVALTARRRIRTSSLLAAGVAGGCLLAGAIEVAQLIVLSRFTDVTDVLLGSIGAAIGARLALGGEAQAAVRWPGRIPPAHRARWLAVLGAYSLFLVAGFWFPFEFTDDRGLIVSRYQDFFRTPLLVLYQGNEFNAIKQLLVRVLLFAPVGAMWSYATAGVRPAGLDRALIVAGVFLVGLLALGIEAGQIAMPGKIADLTEVWLCAIGGVAGLFAMRRILSASGPPTPLPVVRTVADPPPPAATARPEHRAPVVVEPRPSRPMLKVVRPDVIRRSRRRTDS